MHSAAASGSGRSSDGPVVIAGTGSSDGEVPLSLEERAEVGKIFEKAAKKYK